MLEAGEWKDYELLDAGFGEKLERWGAYILRRPDPQAVWPPDQKIREWERADAVYHRAESGGGRWAPNRALPEQWQVGYKHLNFSVQLMQFKHTGLFPEQAVNWDWAAERISGANAAAGVFADTDASVAAGANTAAGVFAGASGSARVRLLNLFAYTGAATVAAASAGAVVCHVDAARGMVAKAKDNAARSRVPFERTRYIVDDVLKFVRREIRRGNRYDAVIMDPPAYGRGPEGELWKAEEQLYALVDLCTEVLAERPLFFLINSYTTGLSAAAIGNILRVAVERRFGGQTESDELGLPIARRGIVLPCGCCGRWVR
ncbi:MAG: class I SAM-dependent methyltransferase [Clostridiales bacterium]|nr:class I SAM-dependent methyltransferase [Clostridiales bacterium]